MSDAETHSLNNARQNSVGIVETKYFTFAAPPDEIQLESGDKLGPVTLAYETYGKLNANKNNAIFILHALSGDAHAAGYHTDDLTEKPGWWEFMIGPGKAFDTDSFFIVCSNIIGGCKGSTGPSSINPLTKLPYAMKFPMITVSDMVKAQKRLLDYLGIKKLLAVSGGSLGGMQALQWAVSYPEAIHSAIPIATSHRLSAQAIALNEVARQAILSDPLWNHGDYYGKEPPVKGLSLARMIGHITYLSETSFDKKFGRQLKDKDGFSYDFVTEFQVESYLKYKGAAFVQRFDANSYLYITRASDYFDLTGDHKNLLETFKEIKTKMLIISYTSDWLFPPNQSLQMVKALRANNIPVSYCNIDSPYGHDSFLIDNPKQSSLVRNFLFNIYNHIQPQQAG
jgi:homoserine O-acetyltransferase